ncbi:MAG: hypothetical protein KatS3mg114_0841 [Planctomycetaceae bacterium]|nr:MAG: hypothetical protein KatS3mg114_0841 [Planctomycetaceae bacterium]
MRRGRNIVGIYSSDGVGTQDAQRTRQYRAVVDMRLLVSRNCAALCTAGPFNLYQHVNASRHGYSCVEVVVVVFTVTTSLIVGLVLSRHFGLIAGIAAGTVTALMCVLASCAFYKWSSRRWAREVREMDKRYPRVYRVLFVPPDLPCVIANGAEIRVGDYGWEAEPIYDDGLIYLHGLTEEWAVAWHAGFRSEQVEVIGEKPLSQYSIPYSWRCAGAKPPPCPFPVQHAPEESLGFPQRIDSPFVQGMKVDVMGKRD